MRNVALTLLGGIAVALGLCEIGVRVILFTPSLPVGGLGASMRQPGRYADGNQDDDYWKLVAAFAGNAGLSDAPNPDPITGWTGPAITPGSYAHVDEATIGARRPVLLYGDSFAQGVTPAEDCFQALLERSELGGKFAMLNYGVGGYGLDQIYLLLKQSIDRFQGQNPIVIVGVLVDSDFERSVLEFRSWPKPRLDIVDDQLVSRGPVQTQTRHYLTEHPIAIRSYLWRLLLHSPSPFLSGAREDWRGTTRLREEKQRLNRRILVEIERELSSRNLQHFYVAFHAEQGALKPWPDFQWQEEMLADVCAAHAAPLFDTRDYLAFAAQGRPEICARFYGQGRPLLGHPNAVGNLICFEAMRQGLRGEFGAPDMAHLERLKQDGLLEPRAMRAKTVALVLLGREATVISHSLDGQLDAAQTAEPRRLLLRSETFGSTLARFELSGAERRFSGLLHQMADHREGCFGAPLAFRVELDGVVALELDVPAESGARAIDLDLTGKHTIAFVVSGDRGGGGCNWVCVENPLWE